MRGKSRHSHVLERAGGRRPVYGETRREAGTRLEERIRRSSTSRRDPGLTFETSASTICADEAHSYKNLQTASNIPGMAVDGLHTRKRSPPEDRVLARAPRRAGHVGYRDPDRQLDRRGIHDAALSAPGSARRSWRQRLRSVGCDVRQDDTAIESLCRRPRSACDAIREFSKRSRNVADVSGRGRQDRPRPRSAVPRSPSGRWSAHAGDGRDSASPEFVSTSSARSACGPGPCPRGPARRRQHAQDHLRRSQSGARHASGAGQPAAGAEARVAAGRIAAIWTIAPADNDPGTGDRTQPGRATDRVLRSGHTQRGLECV